MYTLNVNGKDYQVNVTDGNTPLLWVLRDILGLTGTKYGCGIEVCGACTVMVDGQREHSCVFNVSSAAGKKIATVEGMSKDNSHPVQKAWLQFQVPQCGYCQSGMIMSTAAALKAVSESVIDMLAKVAGVDPFVFRYGILNAERARVVLAVADAFTSWRKSLGIGRAWGVAMSQAFGTGVCEVVEISRPSTSSITVHRVDCVVDCGTVINPDSVEAQMQGGITHGLNAALWGQITFVKGIANQTYCNRNRMMRMSEAPAIRVQIIPSTTAPTGVGEPGVPLVAPALANAFAALTGVRQFSLPFFPGTVMGGL